MNEVPTAKSQRRSKLKVRALPDKVSKEEYWQLHEMILGQFSENYVPALIPVADVNIMHRVAEIKSRQASTSAEELVRMAREELEEASGDVAHAAMLERRNKALEKLLFSHGVAFIPLDLFLRRLLPGDTDPHKRMEIFHKALEWILQFARWSKGRRFEWPESHLLTASRMEKEDGALGIAKAQRERFSNGVSKELALVFGPLILAYHQFVSSRRMRGSMAHDSAELRRKENAVFNAPTPTSAPDSGIGRHPSEAGSKGNLCMAKISRLAEKAQLES